MMDSYPAGSALLTDLYELTMAASYFTEGMFEPATFSLFVRRLPPHRSYLVGAGLESVLHYLEGFRFTDADLAYLRSTARFSESFLEYLRGLRFRGEVWAIPEGRLFFAGEPMLEITASMPEAQIVESYVLNQVHFQSLIATKAARCVYAARDRPVIDFSLRRTHGIDAGLKVARSCYIVGFQSTSNILAGQLYGIPIVGTMAHSYVESFPREIDAFRAFARSFPDRTVLLLDTYDTVSAAHRALVVGRELARAGYRMQGVRLDSGDMVALSRQVRATLDQEGLSYVRILASGGWDEYAIDAAVRQGAPIDIFAVGSRVGVSEDAPYSDMAYKLVQYGQRPVLKLSPGKATLPGPKQVARHRGANGKFVADVLGLRHEDLQPGAEPLLQPMMQDGHLLQPLPSLEEIRERFRRDFAALDERYKALAGADEYPVEISARLGALQQEVARAAPEDGPEDLAL